MENFKEYLKKIMATINELALTSHDSECALMTMQEKKQASFFAIIACDIYKLKKEIEDLKSEVAKLKENK